MGCQGQELLACLGIPDRRPPSRHAAEDRSPAGTKDDAREPDLLSWQVQPLGVAGDPGLPDPYGSLRIGRQRTGSVRRQGGTNHTAVVTDQCEDRHHAFAIDVPEARAAVAAGRQQAGAVGAPVELRNPGGVVRQYVQKAQAGAVVDPHEAGLGGRQQLAVWAPRDLRPAPCVSRRIGRHELAHALACVHVEHGRR